MKTFKLLKCWPNASTVADTDTDTDNVPYFDSVKNLIYGIDYVTNPDEDSFFDLVFTGPDGRPKVVCNSKSMKQRKIGEFDSPIHDSHSKPHSPVSVLGSGIKFRVFLFRFRKSNHEKAGIDDSSIPNPKQLNKTTLFRGNSLRSKLEKEREEEFSVDDSSSSSSKQFARAAELAKFLKLVKRGNSKIRLSDQVLTPLSPPFVQSISSSRKQLDDKQGNRVAAFGAVCKHVMKSRSTTSSFSSSLPAMNRRDDSLLEQNDGIQGAILHCKRSYSTASKDCSMLLARCTAEDVARTSYYEEESRWSI